MRRVLVIGGTHGNERLGIQLVSLLKKNPLPNIDAIIANPRAVAANTRYTESDLNRSFGDLFPGTYETRRAKYLRAVTGQYDVVLDLHNTMTPDNDSSFVGPDCDPRLFGAAATLGLTNCVEATYDCINKACTNTLSIEISRGGEMDNPLYWYKKLSTFIDERTTAGSSVTKYRFLRRVTWKDAELLDACDWRPFQAVKSSDRKKLGINHEVYPIFIGSRLTEYYATLLTKIGDEYDKAPTLAK